MQEQRKYIRYDFEGEAIIKPEDGTSRNLKADLIDISYAGVGLFASEKIEIGTNVKFELMPNLDNQPIIGDGKVKHIKETKKYGNTAFRLGIEFTNIANENIRSIINRIQEDLCAEARKKKKDPRGASTYRSLDY